jgi:hypothetical protein
MGKTGVVATAMCKPGKKAVGGGVSITTDGGASFPNVAITESQPTPNGSGWTATAVRIKQGGQTVVNKTGGQAKENLKVTAVCALVP